MRANFTAENEKKRIHHRDAEYAAFGASRERGGKVRGSKFDVLPAEFNRRERKTKTISKLEFQLTFSSSAFPEPAR
jgi:hypothetical protein